MDEDVCVRVCVCVRERERESMKKMKEDDGKSGLVIKIHYVSQGLH